LPTDREDDMSRYAAIPVQPGEFESDEDLLALDADGWDEPLSEYQRWLSWYKPCAIRCDADHHRAVAEVERLQGLPGNVDIDEAIDLLMTLMAAYRGRPWEELADDYRCGALMVDDQRDPIVRFGNGETGRANALAYTRAIRAGDTEKAAEIMRGCRARMSK
jgi:hypothetical protein